jgi:phosphoserine phosphatase RsbU/P
MSSKPQPGLEIPAQSARVRELRIFTSDGGSRKVRLEGDSLSLGRASRAELSFPEEWGLSRKHLRLARELDEWNICDLGSKNGTVLNQRRLNENETVRLQPGDRISAGHLVMVYDDPNDEATGPGVVVFERVEDDISSSTVVTNLGDAKARGSRGVRQLDALLMAGNELAVRRPLPEMFQRILDLAIEAVKAKRGVLIELDHGGQLAVRAARGDAFRISNTVRDRVLSTHVSVLVRDVRVDQSLNEQESIVAQHVSTLMAVPLQTKDGIIGLIYVDSPSRTRGFSEDDLNLLTVMAHIAATRIEQKRLDDIEQRQAAWARELEQAAEIQQLFLPTRAPQLPGLDLAGFNAPCRTVGGDYYHFFPNPNGRVAMVLGDVAGKGMPASLMMMSLQAQVKVLIRNAGDLGDFMSELNNLTCDNCPTDRFITFFICVLDSATGELTYCNAGHNPPMILRADGILERLEVRGMVMGVDPNAKFEQARTHLEPGDLLVIYSDGVTEAMSPADEVFDVDRLVAALAKNRVKPSAAIVEATHAAIGEWAAGSPPADDLTLIVARRVGS